jgi:competence protein ComEC
MRLLSKVFQGPKRAHRPFVWVSVCFGAGIFWGQSREIAMATAAVLFLAFLGATVCSIRHARWGFFLMSAVVVVTGMIHVRNDVFLPPDHIDHAARYYRRKPIRVTGVIISDVEQVAFFSTRKTRFIMEVKTRQCPWGWERTRGKVLVNLYRPEFFGYGDHLLLEGKIHRPFAFDPDSVFSYQDYLAQRNIYQIISVKKNGTVRRLSDPDRPSWIGGVFALRHKLKGVLHRHLTQAEAQIMQAVLLGFRRNVPAHVRQLFERTGVAHLLAISALHLGIVSFLVFILIRVIPLHRKVQYGVCIAFLLFYTVLTGARPSVMRASAMAIVFLLSLIVEKQGDIFNTLGLSAFIILLIDPHHLFDIGFQLSFLSVFTILVLAPLGGRLVQAVRFFNRSRTRQWLVHSWIISIAAYMGVAGLIAYYFQMITPVSIFVNVLVVPLFSVLVVLGFGLLMSHFLLPAVSGLFAVCLQVLLNIMLGIIFLFSKLPFAYFRTGPVSLAGVFLYYGCLLSAYYVLRLVCRRLSRKREENCSG